MAEPDDVIAPPPMKAKGQQALPANQFAELVSTGFQFGLGVALAFVVVGAALFLLALILGAAALG